LDPAESEIRALVMAPSSTAVRKRARAGECAFNDGRRSRPDKPAHSGNVQTDGAAAIRAMVRVINVIAVTSLLIARGDDFDNPYSASRNQLGPRTETFALNR